jgi:arsenate reductase-like glutaredoxin family protein
MIIYGLETCPLCARAQKTLNDAGIKTTLRDVRAEPLTEAEIATLYAQFGDRMVDTNTNDYRSLGMWLKNSETDAQILAQPKVMARPIIQNGDAWHLGWDDDVKAALL